MSVAPGAPTVDEAAPEPLPTDVPIVLYIDALSPGGTTTYAVALAAGLRGRGHTVVAICSPSLSVAVMRTQLAAADVQVEPWDEGPATFLRRAGRVRRFASLLEEYPGCVLILLMGYYDGGVPITAAARIAGVSAILRADLQPPIGTVRLLDRIGVSLRDRFVDRIIVGAADNIPISVDQLGRDPARVGVIHTGIDRSRLSPGRWRQSVRAELGLAPTAVVVGMASRMAVDWERKGLGLFLDAMARLCATRPEVAVVIAGDGPSRPRLQARAAELGIADRVAFLGWRNDAPAVIDALDVFVMPSFIEGGPTIVLEAMAMGKAVVATAVGMVPEVVEHGRTGLVVRPGDLDGLCAALLELVTRPELRADLGASALAVSPAFDRGRMVDGYRAEAERARRARWIPGQERRAALVEDPGPVALDAPRGDDPAFRPRVSFVVTNHNYSRYLEHAIGGLLAQTYTSLEIIVVDDCSTDNSREVLQRYADHARVRLVYHEQNQGSIHSYNEGLHLARGEFVGVFDADDYSVSADGVARQVAMFDANPDVGFVYSGFVIVDETNTPFRESKPWSSDHVRSGLDAFADLLFLNTVPHSGTLVRRSCHEVVSYYDTRLPYAGDWDLWLRLAARFAVGYIAVPLYAYRVHRLNMTNRGKAPGEATRERLQAVHNAFAALPPNAPGSIRALRRAAVRKALLTGTWNDRSFGRTRRSWEALVDATRRAPSLLLTQHFWDAIAHLVLLSAIGHRRYERLAAWRESRGKPSLSTPAGSRN